MTGTEPIWLADARLRAARRVLWLRATWGSDRSADDEPGMAVSHREVDRILAEPADSTSEEWRFYEHDHDARRLTAALASIDSMADPRWANLVALLGLTAPEANLLALALAAEAHPELRRVYGYLIDDVAPVDATPALAAAVFGWPAGARIDPGSSLISWELAGPVDAGRALFSQSTGWEADPAILAYLLGDDEPATLGTHGELTHVDHLPVLFPELVEAVATFASTMLAASGPRVEVELVGPAGSGRRVVLGQVAAAIDRPLIVVDAGRLGGADAAGDAAPAARAATREVRHARLAGALLAWADADRLPSPVWAAASARERLTFLTSETALPVARGTVRRAFAMPRLDRTGRLRLWSVVGHGAAPTPVASWALTPGEVVTAAHAAPAGEEAVGDVCRLMLLRAPRDLLVPVPLPYTWDDLVLPANLAAHLHEMEAQARTRAEILDDWGLARLCPMGRGLTALFAGPSGTGKTMSAQVLARSLGLGLYRVDLAGVVNKYIGETEKHLRALFDSCERSPAVLFFDEADALFGQRTQVKDAHDRFANIEIDYLLQRMEEFDGIAILASNRKGDLDSAFVRRLRFIVDFVPPTAAERERLWRLALEGQTARDGRPLVGDVDWRALAEGLQLTGADIKSAALAAAFLARSESSPIATRHVFAAARRELAKQGIVVRPGQLVDQVNGR